MSGGKESSIQSGCMGLAEASLNQTGGSKGILRRGITKIGTVDTKMAMTVAVAYSSQTKLKWQAKIKSHRLVNEYLSRRTHFAAPPLF